MSIVELVTLLAVLVAVNAVFIGALAVRFWAEMQRGRNRISGDRGQQSPGSSLLGSS